MTEARQCDKCLSLDRHPVNRALSMQIAVTRNLGTAVTARILREEQRLQKTTAYLFIFQFFLVIRPTTTNKFIPSYKLRQNNHERFRKNFQKVKLFLNSHRYIVLSETHAVLYFHCSSLQVFFCLHLTMQGCIGISPSSSAKILAGVFFGKIDRGALVSCRKDPQNER